MKELEKEINPKNNVSPEPIIEIEKKEEDTVINIDLTVGSERYPDVFIEFRPDKITSVDRQQQNIFQFSCKNGIQLRIEVYSDQILRFRYSLKKEFPTDFSYAIDEQFTAQEATIDYHVFQDHFEISTA
ncbi:MAG: hypothetical protein ACI8X3_002553, partial [Saprospiraceae bacterium]